MKERTETRWGTPIPVFPQTFYKAIDTLLYISGNTGMGEVNIPSFVSIFHPFISNYFRIKILLLVFYPITWNHTNLSAINFGNNGTVEKACYAHAINGAQIAHVITYLF